MSLFGVECWAGVGRARLGTAGSEPTGGLRLYCPAAGLSSGILSPPSPEELFIILKPFAAWGGGGGGLLPAIPPTEIRSAGRGAPQFMVQPFLLRPKCRSLTAVTPPAAVRNASSRSPRPADPGSATGSLWPLWADVCLGGVDGRQGLGSEPLTSSTQGAGPAGAVPRVAVASVLPAAEE